MNLLSKTTFAATLAVLAATTADVLAERPRGPVRAALDAVTPDRRPAVEPTAPVAVQPAPVQVVPQPAPVATVPAAPPPPPATPLQSLPATRPNPPAAEHAHAPKGADLIGLVVMDPRSQRLGIVKDVLLDPRTGEARLLIVAVEEELVVFPFETFRIVPAEERRFVAVLNLEPTIIQRAPRFEANQWNLLQDPQFISRVANFYTGIGVTTVIARQVTAEGVQLRSAGGREARAESGITGAATVGERSTEVRERAAMRQESIGAGQVDLNSAGRADTRIRPTDPAAPSRPDADRPASEARVAERRSATATERTVNRPIDAERPREAASGSTGEAAERPRETAPASNADRSAEERRRDAAPATGANRDPHAPRETAPARDAERRDATTSADDRASNAASTPTTTPDRRTAGDQPASSTNDEDRKDAASSSAPSRP